MVSVVGILLLAAIAVEASAVKKCGHVSSSEDTPTASYYMQQTMLRVKNASISIDFYTKILGMTLLLSLDVPPMNYTIYILGYENPKNIPCDKEARRKWTFSRPATIELTYVWGAENDPKPNPNNDNANPFLGFGHIGIAVPDVYEACKRFDKFGVKYAKRPDEGGIKGLAYIKDPDGYQIEILSPRTINDVIEQFDNTGNDERTNEDR